MSETTFLAAVLFLLFALICGSIIQWVVSKVKAYKPPVSILWFAFGMLICAIEVLVVPEKSEELISIDGVTVQSAPHIFINIEHPLGLLGIGIAEAARVHSSVLYYVVLPILLYDATQQISWHHFRKSLKTGLLLAIAGVVFQVAVIGLLTQYTFTRPAVAASRMLADSRILMTNDSAHADEPIIYSPLQRGLGFLWRGPKVNHGQSTLPKITDAVPSLSFSMMTAAAVASTDPIAVLSILEEMDAPAQFASLFDSEALINDGSSIFLFTFFKSLTRGKSQTWQESLGRFATLLIIGPTFGFLCASLMYRWLKHYRWYPHDKTLAVVFASYLVFFIAEIYLQTSGPLAIVVYGLYFKAYAKAAFEADATEVHHHFVRGCATAATSVVFIISGIASFRMMWDALTSQASLALPDDMPELEPEGLAAGYEGFRGKPSSQLWRVPVFYMYLIGARFLMIGVFFPLLRKFLGEFSWKEYILLSWGGLRGAVCLILALLIEQDDHIDQDLSASAALYISSSAFLILFANGITFEFLYKLLRPYKVNLFRQVYLKKVMKLVDKEYFNEVALLQQHWLFEKSWALIYADKLVPRLGNIHMDSFGKIHLHKPKIGRVLRDYSDSELLRAIPKVAVDKGFVVRAGKVDDTGVSPRSNLVREPSKTSGPKQDDNAGHSTAAVLQRLRRPPESGLDLEMNLRLLDQEDDSFENAENVVGGAERVLTRIRQHSNPDNSACLQNNVPGWQEHDEEDQQTSVKRIPGYRFDSVVRMRSEPSAALDAAQLKRWESMFAEGQNISEHETTPKGAPGLAITRTMSVPNNLTIAERSDAQFAMEESAVPQPLLAKDREGEILVMTINTMRQLYKRMYEQCFISGTVFVGFMATADVVADFGLMDANKRCKVKAWREVCADGGKKRGVSVDLPERENLTRARCCRGHRPNLPDSENITGFEVEWQLTASKLRARPRHFFERGVHLVTCRKHRRLTDVVVSPPPLPARTRSPCQQWMRAKWTALWSALGPRQTFPALDDLQLVCAFVDVHQELLMRGDTGLKTMLGPKMLDAYQEQTRKAKETVTKLTIRYPDSFPFAMLCHAGIFLVNLKIQLTEEQYERGLLLADDKEIICELLKEQLVLISKFHPPFLFT